MSQSMAQFNYEPTVRDYFQTLSKSMMSAEVTDHHGASIPLEEGAQRAIEMILETNLLINYQTLLNLPMNIR